MKVNKLQTAINKNKLLLFRRLSKKYEPKTLFYNLSMSNLLDKPKFFEVFLKRGLSPDNHNLSEKYKYSYPLIYFTIFWDYYESFILLLKYNADPNNYFISNSTSPLAEAINHSRFSFIKPLVDHGADVNFVNMETRDNLLHYCCRMKNYFFLKYFLMKNVDINSVSINGTPLDYAIKMGFLEGARILNSFGGKCFSNINNNISFFRLNYNAGRDVSKVVLKKDIEILDYLLQDIVDLFGIFRNLGVKNIVDILGKFFSIRKKYFLKLIDLLFKLRNGRLIFGKFSENNKVTIIENIFLN